jgi:hypothetical protein
MECEVLGTEEKFIEDIREWTSTGEIKIKDELV